MKLPYRLLASVSCNGESDGAIDITVLNGSGPYTYQWSNGTTSEDLASVGVGDYSVTITDASGCSIVTNVAVGVNPDSTNCDDGNGDGDKPRRRRWRWRWKR